VSTEFDLNNEDFEAELHAMEGMIASLESTGSGRTPPRARVVGANAAVLFLAATFEEFVRQQVKSVFSHRASAAATVDELSPKLAAVVWRKSLDQLARSDVADWVLDTSGLSARLDSIIRFCVGKDVSADVGDVLAHNEQNLRPAELGKLFNQVGLKSIVAKAAEFPALMHFLGCETPGKSDAELQSRLEGFFIRRNEIAHAIRLNASSGPPTLATDIQMFRLFASGITAACATHCGLQAHARHTAEAPENSEGA